MVDNIKNATRRDLTHVIGFDANGKGGKSPMLDRPYWGAVMNSSIPQSQNGSGYAYAKTVFKGFLVGSLLGAIARFTNIFGSDGTSGGTTTITRLVVRFKGVNTEWTFDGGSASKVLSGTGYGDTDPCTVPAGPGDWVEIRLLANNPAGVPLCSVPTYLCKTQYSSSPITDDLSNASPSGMFDAEWTFMPLAFMGWTNRPTVGIFGCSRDNAGYLSRGLGIGPVGAAITKSAAVINLSVGGAPIWKFGASNADAIFAQVGGLITHGHVGDPVNDLGDTVSAIKSNIVNIQTKWDAGARMTWSVQTCLPYSVPGTASVTSITRSGTLATVTIASTANLRTGQYVTIAGASPSGYNGKKQIIVTSGTTFTFDIAGSPSTPATGTITYSDGYVGQSLGHSTAREATRQTLNYDFRSMSAISRVAFCVDLAKACEDPADPSKWAPQFEVDQYGLHLETNGVARLATAVPVGAFAGPAFIQP